MDNFNLKKYLAEGRLLKEFDTPDDGDVTGWYWPIADQAMEILKKENEGISLGAVGDGDRETYIGITVDYPNGSEERFNVYFDENEKVTNIEKD